MKKLPFLITSLILLFSSFAFSASASERIYLLEIEYDNGQVNIGEVSTKIGQPSDPEKPELMNLNKYWIELVSFNEKVLEKRMFSFSLEVFIDRLKIEDDGTKKLESESYILDKTEHFLLLPYYPKGKTFKLYDTEMNLLDERDVGFLADVCGDGICQEHESYESCDKDCAAAAKDDYCNEEKMEVDPDCEKFLGDGASSAKTNEKILPIFYFAISIIVILFALGIFIRKKKKKKLEEENFIA
jgi:hypothetical protein